MSIVRETHIGQILPTGRDENKLFHYVRHLDDLSDTARTRLDKLGAGIAQLKEDGVFCALVVQPYWDTYRIGLFSRTGRGFTNVNRVYDQVEKLLESDVLPSGVYFGELVNRNLTLEELSGAVNPNRVKPLNQELQDSLDNHLQFKLFDRIELEEFLDGRSHTAFQDRWLHLVQLCLEDLGIKFGDEPVAPISLIEARLVYGVDDFLEYTDRLTALGFEGAVFRHNDSKWTAGAKDFSCVKKVRSVSYDLLCVGYETGKGKRAGVVSNLLFKWRDGQIKADLGKGWTDADRERISKNPSEVLGCIFKVYGLQDSSKGKIRLAKVGELRIDKTEPDF